MRVAADRASWSLVLLLVVACKPARAPDTGELADDLAQIEAELQRSDARLGDAGIVVAYRDTRSAEDAAAPPQESPAEPIATEPTTTPPPETEPEAEPAPTPTTPSAEEPVLAPDASEDDAPRISSRRSERERATVRDRQDARESRRRVKKSARTRCERVCELTETTCELQERVCTLADDHPDDVRYEDACRRAEDQCEAATRSCESCAV